MFLDLQGYYSRKPEPPGGQPQKRRLTPREEKVLLWVICFNIVMLVVAPIGGATVIQALISALTG